MKVGDYVRFKTLSREIKIGKVIEIIEPDKESMKKYCVYDLDNNEATVDDYVIKSSPKIIDLIEVGDYVNGKKVLDVAIDYIFDYSEEIKIVYFDIDKKDYIYSKVDIKSILTKEQFESMEYKVGCK